MLWSKPSSLKFKKCLAWGSNVTSRGHASNSISRYTLEIPVKAIGILLENSSIATV